jgi:hypothetical protein
MMTGNVIEAISGSSCVAEVAVSSAKVAVVVLSDVGKAVVGKVLGIH